MTSAQKRAFKTADLSNGDFINDFKDSLSGDLNIERILKTCRFEKFPMEHAKNIFWLF